MTEQNNKPQTDYSSLPPDPEMADWVQRIPAALTSCVLITR